MEQVMETVRETGSRVLDALCETGKAVVGFFTGLVKSVSCSAAKLVKDSTCLLYTSHSQAPFIEQRQVFPCHGHTHAACLFIEPCGMGRVRRAAHAVLIAGTQVVDAHLIVIFRTLGVIGKGRCV